MTKTHVIDGVTYVEANRLAKSGDKIYSDWSDEIYTVEDVTEQMAVITKPGQLGHLTGFYHGTYDVLEPMSTEASPDVTDLLANLARRLEVAERRVTSLEDQLRSTQRNLETTAEELANTRHRLMKYADRFAAVEDKVEMLTDDIVDLDSRSQVLNAINKYYAEGSR